MSYKELVLQNFIESNKFLPKQGSKEWLDSRLDTIGGSEISTIIGLNPYQNIKKLIMQKLGITKFVKSAPLWFGNILAGYGLFSENRYEAKINLMNFGKKNKYYF